MTNDQWPVNLNRLVRCQAVQEQPVVCGHTSWTMTLLLVTANYSTLPERRLRFTDVSLMSDTPGQKNVLLTGNYCLVNRLAFTDCQLRGGRIYLVPFYDDWRGMTVALTNNLVQRAILRFTRGYYGDETPLWVYFRNNLFLGGTVGLADQTGERTWAIHDNLCDGVNLSSSGTNFPNSHNAYHDTTPLPGSSGGDQFPEGADLQYQKGPFGDYYLTDRGPALNKLVDKGSRSSSAAGLYHYTTLANQNKELDSTVDIGLHYVAAASGLPIDSDQEGLPDYFEDQNGDGQWNGAETDWTRADTDGDGLSDLQELELSYNVLVNDPAQDLGTDQNTQSETTLLAWGNNVLVAYVDSNLGVPGYGMPDTSHELSAKVGKQIKHLSLSAGLGPRMGVRPSPTKAPCRC
jgi:hypothetical protein